MGRAWQAFIAMEPPTVTHNDLCIQWKQKKGGARVPYIAKTDRLRRAEADLASYVARAACDSCVLPLSGPLRETVRFMWEPTGRHGEGTARLERPDLDNICKTFNDVLEQCKVIDDDAHVVDLRMVKAYAHPAGIFVRIEELR